jgi:hypothetical protein
VADVPSGLSLNPPQGGKSRFEVRTETRYFKKWYIFVFNCLFIPRRRFFNIFIFQFLNLAHLQFFSP